MWYDTTILGGTEMQATVRVVGMVAGGRQHVVADVGISDPVLLLPEPANPHDQHAIAVHTMPRRLILHPEALTSSLTDPARVGTIHPEDRMLIVDRQAGYVPRDVAAQLRLPAEGIVGFVAWIRHAPNDYGPDGVPLPAKPAGFDVCAWWPAPVDDHLDDDLNGGPR